MRKREGFFAGENKTEDVVRLLESGEERTQTCEARGYYRANDDRVDEVALAQLHKIVIF